MTNAEVIARLKANREAIVDLEKTHGELAEFCRRDKIALTIAINRLEKAENKNYDGWIKALKFLLITALGILLTKIGMQMAYTERGYFALGGEIFILPATYFLFYGLESALNSIKKTFKELLSEEEKQNESKKISGN